MAFDKNQLDPSAKELYERIERRLGLGGDDETETENRARVCKNCAYWLPPVTDAVDKLVFSGRCGRFDSVFQRRGKYTNRTYFWCSEDDYCSFYDRG